MKKQFLELAPDYRGDRWAYAMAAGFDMAAEGYNRGLADILGYTPGACGAHIEDEYNAEILTAMSDDDLLDLMKYTHRVIEMLKHAGIDY